MKSLAICVCRLQWLEDGLDGALVIIDETSAVEHAALLVDGDFLGVAILHYDNAGLAQASHEAAVMTADEPRLRTELRQRLVLGLGGRLIKFGILAAQIIVRPEGIVAVLLTLIESKASSSST